MGGSEEGPSGPFNLYELDLEIMALVIVLAVAESILHLIMRLYTVNW